MEVMVEAIVEVGVAAEEHGIMIVLPIMDTFIVG